MSGKGSTYADDLLKLIFNATAIANIADNASASPLTTLYVSLHSADPGPAGNQTTSEVAYTGYARIGVARTAGGFTVSGTAVSFVAAVVFGTCTGGTATATFFAIGTASSGAGKLLYTGPVTPNITITSSMPSPPQLLAASGGTES